MFHLKKLARNGLLTIHLDNQPKNKFNQLFILTKRLDVVKKSLTLMLNISNLYPHSGSIELNTCKNSKL